MSVVRTGPPALESTSRVKQSMTDWSEPVCREYHCWASLASERSMITPLIPVTANPSRAAATSAGLTSKESTRQSSFKLRRARSAANWAGLPAIGCPMTTMIGSVVPSMMTATVKKSHVKVGTTIRLAVIKSSVRSMKPPTYLTPGLGGKSLAVTCVWALFSLRPHG